MKTALMLLLAASTALAQDDLDGAIRGLAEKLSREGLAGRLADALAGDAGVQAVHEKIDFLLAARISRFERDAVGHLEDYLFTVDAAGEKRLRMLDQHSVVDAARRVERGQRGAPQAVHGCRVGCLHG